MEIKHLISVPICRGLPTERMQAVAQALLAKEKALQRTVSEQELQRAQLWIGEWEWRGW